MKINQKTALITGGARRVGRVLAESLAQRGVNLVIHYNKSQQEALDLQEKLIKDYKISVDLFQADLCEIAELEKKASDLIAKKTIHILINNASSFYPTPFGEISLSDWDNLVKSNLTGPFFLTQVIAKSMLEAKEGKIVNIADWSAERPYKNFMPYSIAKAGVVAMTKILAQSLAPYIQVNTISPGAILLPEDISDELKNKLIEKAPLKRIGDPNDIAQAMLFFLEGSDFATGANLIVDGGRLIN
jgi:NAD(P)-dependent dehydrogenase (short-subunit alcohol dehydrogenase family)